MNTRYLLSGGLAILAAGTTLAAQTASSPETQVSPPIILQQSFTTGMVGFTTNQTARLNVLNLNSVPAGTTAIQPANCSLELQFFDDQNGLIKHTTVANLAPGTATSFDLPRASVTSETAARAEIRGVVVVNSSPTPVPSPVAVPAVLASCTVFTTLEILDVNNSTVALTSDTRAVGATGVVPLAAERRSQGLRP